MNKKIVYIIVGALVVVGIIMMTMQQPQTSVAPDQNATSTTSGNQTSESDNGVINGTVADILKAGNRQCTFAQSTAYSTTNGKVSVSNGKMRGDFETTVTGAGATQTVTSHTLMDGSFTYVWTSLSNTGFKSPVVNGVPQMGTGSGSAESVDLNQKINYNCTSWTPDSRAFELPAGVTFTGA